MGSGKGKGRSEGEEKDNRLSNRLRLPLRHPPQWLRSLAQKSRTRSADIWSNLLENNLWRRILKFSVATTVTLIIAVLPDVIELFGPTSFLAPLTTIFAHPGQRMGLMVEALIQTFAGCVLATAWSFLGLWLSSLVLEENPDAAYSIRAVFLLCAVFHHGFLRSSSPRLIVYVLFHLTICAVVLLGSAQAASTQIVTSIAYPILIGAGSSLCANLLIFPELSYTYLAQIAIDAISETTIALCHAVEWFLDSGNTEGDAAQEPDQAQPTSYDHLLAKGTKQPSQSSEYQWFTKILPGFRNPFHAPQGKPVIVTVPREVTSLASLTDSKTALRSKLRLCKAAQSQVNLEISIGPLPPASMKPITSKIMTGLVHNAMTLIGSCENKFVLDGSDETSGNDSAEDDGATDDMKKVPAKKTSGNDPAEQLELVKPLRELEAADIEVLEAIISRIRKPVMGFVDDLRQATAVVTAALAYCYGLPKLRSGMPTPKRIILEEMDVRIDAFVDALTEFDKCSMMELELASKSRDGDVDILPRMETFLVSSFLLGLRQAAVHLLQLLRYSRVLVERRQQTPVWTRFHMPHYGGWRQWLSTGGENDAMVLPQSMRKKARTGRDQAEGNGKEEEVDAAFHEHAEAPAQQPKDEENLAREEGKTDKTTPTKTKKATRKDRRRAQRREIGGLAGVLTYVRMRTADVYESLQKSDDAVYAMKLVVAFFLVSWPGFIPSWHGWYSEVRGSWAATQLILIFEVAIGTSLFVFILRLVGVGFGCLMALLAWEIGRGHKVPLIIILCLGIIPSVYVQLGTKYVKAGMVSITSLSTVALMTVNGNGTSHHNFISRVVTFLIGASAGLLVGLVLYPARARDRLVESLSTSIRHISKMQTALAVGVDNPKDLDLRSQKILKRFDRSREKAQGALAAAETFLPFCLTEPRLKGSFRHIHPIYREIIYVLHQIVDRMDNMMQLRRVYGSSVLEELNSHVHAYRRAVAASITIALFSVHEALMTRMPLPQFIPSARLAMLRLVHRVREVLKQKAAEHSDGQDRPIGEGLRRYIDKVRREADKSGPQDERSSHVATHHKFLSWNANAAGQMEIVEYLEELVELAKLLVGVNAFRSGMLERPTFSDYAERARGGRMVGGLGGHGKGPHHDGGGGGGQEQGVTSSAAEEPPVPEPGIPLRKVDTARSSGWHAPHPDLGIQLGGRLRRTSTRSSRPQDWENAIDDSIDESEVPISLQRVSSRRSRRRSSTLRRSNTRPHGDLDGNREGGDLKGKGIDEEDENESK